MTQTDQAWLQIIGDAKPNTWVALNEGGTELWGQGRSFAEAVEDAARNGHDDPVLFLIPPDWQAVVSDGLLMEGLASSELTEEEFWESVDRETNAMLSGYRPTRITS